MQYKYVQKCNCCEERLSIMRFDAISVRHKYALICLMTDVLEELGMKGRLALVCTDDLIIAFNYTYASEDEYMHSEIMCETLRDIANGFAWEQVSKPKTHCYSL